MAVLLYLMQRAALCRMLTYAGMTCMTYAGMPAYVSALHRDSAQRDHTSTKRAAMDTMAEFTQRLPDYATEIENSPLQH